MGRETGRAAAVFEHPAYQREFLPLQEAEKDRKFCRHTLEHFLDVARLTWILCLEEKCEIDREQIYAAALLHDLGRYRQISEGIPHEKASVMLAKEILPDCGFTQGEIGKITEAIDAHRGSGERTENSRLAELLYKADKLSRNCFACPASGECNWNEEKKNHRIIL
ncbi:MAG: HD domain-containing protein [Eubacteriales bacterium]|nr:HD domain-containing protein [Eubacteriales bacterium]